MVVGVLTQIEHSHSTERRGEEIKRCYDFPELREFCVGACIQLLLNYSMEGLPHFYITGNVADLNPDKSFDLPQLFGRQRRVGEIE